MTDQMTDEKPAPSEPHPRARQSLLLPIAIPLVSLVVIGLVLFGFSRVLLSISAHAATFVALIVAVSIMVVAIVVASRQRLSNGSLFSMVIAIAGIAMVAGGLAIVTIGSGAKEETGPPPLAVALTAPKGAAVSGFTESSLQFQADRPTDLDFDNEDAAVQHNVVIFSEDPAKNPQAAPVFTGALETGPAKVTYKVQALSAGTYYFHCEVHPTTMTGTIDVGSGPVSLAVVAEGLAFNTKQLDLASGQPSKIAFQNKDTGTLHNIAIYSDSSKAETLFQGEQIAGPSSTVYNVPALDEGTYYFQCDVHPVMNGDVVVGPPGGASGAPPPSASGATPSG
jgi:plastocyanin/uncharacterized membrane protein (DUF485 family)